MRIDEERTGWAKLSDLIHHKDKDRVEDVKEDIDTLLVFVGSPWVSMLSCRHSHSHNSIGWIVLSGDNRLYHRVV